MALTTKRYQGLATHFENLVLFVVVFHVSVCLSIPLLFSWESYESPYLAYLVRACPAQSSILLKKRLRLKLEEQRASANEEAGLPAPPQSGEVAEDGTGVSGYDSSEEFGMIGGGINRDFAGTAAHHVVATLPIYIRGQLGTISNLPRPSTRHASSFWFRNYFHGKN
jgi:hypothetical protein